MLTIFGTIIIFTLVSCAAPTPARTVTPNYAKKVVYPYLEVPSWLCNLPEGENAIGIAWNNENSKPNLDDVAREGAAVSLTRNHSSFVVDKTAVIKYAEQTELTSIGRDFKIVVSADTSYLNWADRNLISQASTSFNGYKLSLFSVQTLKPDKTIIRCSIANLPAWTKKSDVYLEDGYLYIPGFSSQAGLIDAWKTAQENALRKLAQYRLTTVLGSLRSTEDWTKKLLILETVTQSPNATMSNSWIYQKKVDTLNSYGVYILLKVKAPQ